MNMEYEKRYNKIHYDKLRKNQNGNDEVKRQTTGVSNFSRDTRESSA